MNANRDEIYERNRSLMASYERLPLRPLVHLIMKHLYCSHMKNNSLENYTSKDMAYPSSKERKKSTTKNSISSDDISIGSQNSKSEKESTMYCVYCDYSRLYKRKHRLVKHLKLKTHLLKTKYHKNNLMLNSLYKENKIASSSTKEIRRWIRYLSLLRFLVDMINSFDCIRLQKDVLPFFHWNECDDSSFPSNEASNSLFYDERWYKAKCMSGSFKSNHPLFRGIEYFALDLFDVESLFPFFMSPYRTNDGKDEGENSDFDETIEHTNPPINPCEMGYEKCNKYCFLYRSFQMR